MAHGVQVAQLFRDEITVDNLPRGQLAALAKFAGLSPFAPEPLLRLQVRWASACAAGRVPACLQPLSRGCVAVALLPLTLLAVLRPVATAPPVASHSSPAPLPVCLSLAVILLTRSLPIHPDPRPSACCSSLSLCSYA